MKNSTLLFLVKKFNCSSSDISEIIGYETENDSTEMESSVHIPSAQTIRRIMDFARAYSVMETETAGHVEMILN